MIYSCRLLRSILGLRCLLPGPSRASPSSGADQAHPHPLLRLHLLPTTDAKNRCEYYFCGFFYYHYFALMQHRVFIWPFFLQDYTGPWIKPPRRCPSVPLAPLPSSPDVIIIEEEPEADGEPDIQVREVLEATTAQP